MDEPSLQVEHSFRREAGRIAAILTRTFGAEHLDLVEDAVQEAFLQALRSWPFTGEPLAPGAWLLTTARNRAFDALRHRAMAARRVGRDGPGALPVPPFLHDGRGEPEDDQLRLLFILCQPAVATEDRVALVLKVLGGFSTGEIARAYLAKEATVAQRLVRAKRRIRERRPPFAVPEPAELATALSSVLEAIYAMFNEGNAATEGDHLVRADIAGEALRLSRLVARHPALARHERTPEAHALAALLHLQAARHPEREDGAGNLTLLSDQDRSAWDRGLLAQGFAHLERAAQGCEVSIYHLEAGIAATHAGAPSFEETDWRQILTLYDLLLAKKPAPVVVLNRAVALGQVEGPKAGLAALASLEAGDGSGLAGYTPFHVARGELALRAGDLPLARASFARALRTRCPEPLRRRIEARLREANSADTPEL